MAKRDDPPVTTVFDTGRRGAPRMGCDCLQCFGYCDVNHDRYMTDVARYTTDAERARLSLLEAGGLRWDGEDRPRVKVSGDPFQ